MSDLIRRIDAVTEIHKYFVAEIEKTPTVIDEDGDELYADMKTVNSLLACNKELSKRIKALPSAEVTGALDEAITKYVADGYMLQPSAEAVKGEWIITKEGEYDGRSVYKTVCSECGHETFYKANKAHFCPNCGCSMKKGD